MRSTLHRLLCFGFLAVSLCAALPALAAEQDWAWNYNLFLGRMTVNNADWDPFSHFDEVGVEASWGLADEPLYFATDLYAAQEDLTQDGTSVDSKYFELDLGFRKTWTLKQRWNFSLGTGPAIVSGDVDLITNKHVENGSDRTLGWFFGGNFFYRVGPQLNIGIAAHFTPTGELHIGPEGRSGTSAHLGLIIGWGAPISPPAK
jgi:hypothetical protein